MTGRWRIVALLMGFTALGHFNRVGISVAGDERFIPDLGISETQMGWVYTGFLIVYTSGMLPAGWLIDRIGSGLAMTLYGLTMGTFVALTGVVGWLTESPAGLWIGLLLIRGLAGLCSAPLHPGAAHVVSEVVPPHRRATANGMVTAGALIGIACCYPGYGWLLDTVDWQWTFIVCGGLMVAFSTVWGVTTLPKLLRQRQEAKLAAVTDSQKATPTVWSLLVNQNLLLVTFSYAAYSYFQYLIFYWMGHYFKNELLVPDADARWASFWIMLAMGAGMMIGGRGTDVACELMGRTGGRRAIVLVGMGLGAVFGYVALNMSSLVGVAGCLAISMAFTGMVEGVFWSTATDIGGRSRGLCGAFMNTGGNVGGLISPILTPVIAETLGWQGSIILACLISGVGSLVWLLIKLGDEPIADR